MRSVSCKPPHSKGGYVWAFLHQVHPDRDADMSTKFNRVVGPENSYHRRAGCPWHKGFIFSNGMPRLWLCERGSAAHRYRCTDTDRVWQLSTVPVDRILRVPVSAASNLFQNAHLLITSLSHDKLSKVRSKHRNCGWNMYIHANRTLQASKRRHQLRFTMFTCGVHPSRNELLPALRLADIAVLCTCVPPWPITSCLRRYTADPGRAQHHIDYSTAQGTIDWLTVLRYGTQRRQSRDAQ